MTSSTYRWLAIGWSIIIFIGCAMPGNELPDMSHGTDKWVHFVGFAPIGLLWSLSGRTAVWTILFGAIFGMLIEIYQGVMPIGRSFDLFDALADTIGTLMGIGLFWLYQRWFLARRL